MRNGGSNKRMSEIDISIDQLGMQVICERVRLLGGRGQGSHTNQHLFNSKVHNIGSGKYQLGGSDI